MNCNEVLELVTPAVDGKLDLKLESHLQNHFEKCPACRNEFELERITKRVFKQHLYSVPAPQALSGRVSAQLMGLTREGGLPGFHVNRFVFRPAWKAFATAAAAVAAILLLILVPLKPQHTHARPLDGDIINQTYNHFGEVLNGTMIPAIASEDPSAVQSYMDSRVGFRTHVPKLKHYKLMGGVHSHYNDENIAHVIYKQRDNVIYLYQVSLRSVMNGRTLHLPDQAKMDLLRTGWYSEKQCPGCALVLWSVDSTVCCAVADLDKHELLTFFNGSE